MVEEQHPSFRPMEIVPALSEEGHPLFVLSDPLGIFEETLILNPQTAHLVSLMDGSRSTEDLRMTFFRKFGALPATAEINGLVQELEAKGLLQGEVFDRMVSEKVEEIRTGKVRVAAHSGQAYPDTPEELNSFLEKILDGENACNRQPDLIIAPHLDISLAAGSYAAAYRGIEADEECTVVLFGVAHQGLTQPLVLCPLNYHTPLGTLPVETDWVHKWENLTSPVDDMDLLVHSLEHSLEFQLLFLQKILGTDSFSILPFLISIDPTEAPDETYFEMAVNYFSELRASRNTLFIAGIDLAHIGPRYGDQEPVSEATMEEVKSLDRVFIESFRNGDRPAMVNFLKEHGAQQRICGAGVLYLLTHLGFQEIKLLDHSTGWMQEVDSAVTCVAMHGWR